MFCYIPVAVELLSRKKLVQEYWEFPEVILIPFRLIKKFLALNYTQNIINVLKNFRP